MGRQQARQRIGQRIRLPSLPGVVERIQSALRTEEVDLQEVARLVAQEPSLTARLLRTANSAYYGLAEPAVSTDQAAAVVGSRTLETIVLQESLVGRFKHLEKELDFDLGGVWHHSILTAQICQKVGEEMTVTCEDDPQAFYTCGLLHDVGKVVLLDELRQEYVDVVKQASGGTESLHGAEERILGFNHIDVGALVAVHWNLPETLSVAISGHHGPTADVLADPVTAAVALSDQLAYRLMQPDFEDFRPRLAKLAFQALGVSEASFDKVVDHALEVHPLVQI